MERENGIPPFSCIPCKHQNVLGIYSCRSHILQDLKTNTSTLKIGLYLKRKRLGHQWELVNDDKESYLLQSFHAFLPDFMCKE